MEEPLFNNVIPGTVLSRVEDEFAEKQKTYKVITLLELSYKSGESNDRDFEKTVKLPDITSDKYVFVENGDLVFALTKRKAMVIEEKKEMAILPTNFVHLTYDENKYNNYFLMWLFNENSNFKKKLNLHIQGSALKMIPVRVLREIAFETPDISTQNIIGNLYQKELMYEKKVWQHKEIMMEFINGLNNKKRGDN